MFFYWKKFILGSVFLFIIVFGFSVNVSLDFVQRHVLYANASQSGNKDECNPVINCKGCKTEWLEKKCKNEKKVIDEARERRKSEVSDTEVVARNVVYFIFVNPMAVLTKLGASLADMMIDPETFNGVFGGAGWMYKFWSLVRDILNIFLVLVLLLSAFSTIFQIQKWHLKNTLLMIVLMALLVNFSWPITRMFVDIGNITMYSLYDQLAGKTKDGEPRTLANAIGEGSDFISILTTTGNEKTETVSVPIMKGIFLFAFAITLITVGILLLLRIIIFVILLIFSPIGFVAAAFPSTRQYASQWWDSMLKWTFLGPIMIFMIFLSISLINQLGDTNNSLQVSGNFTANNIVQSIQYIVAIVVLWSGIIAAQKLGGSAAGFVTSRAQSAAKRGGKYIGKKYWGSTKKAAKGAWGVTKMTGRAIDNHTGNSVAKVAGRVQNVKKRWNTLGEDSKTAWKTARDASSARGLADEPDFGGDEFAYEKFKTQQVNSFINDKLKDKVGLSTAEGMLENEEDPTSIRGQALQKFIASHKDLDHIDDKQAPVIAELIKSNKLSPPESKGVETSLRKNGHADALKGVYGAAFADKVVKKLDAESLAKSAKLLKEAAENLNSAEAKTITQKLSYPDFEKDFLKHAGNQGLDPKIIQKFSQKTNDTTSNKIIIPSDSIESEVRAARNATSQSNNTNP